MSDDAAENADGREARPVPATIRYLGDYELLAEIGRGGMGVVYKARQMSLNRLVAVKMILAGEFARPAEIQRFRTEAEAAANLRHPGIVTIFEVGEHEGHQYYSMDLVEGESLASLIHRQQLPLRQAVGLVVQIARAVHFAHQRGIIHRDLKPSNVLVDDTGQAKVVDFGLAKQADRHREMTLSGALLGTPAYMSPEQAQGKIRQITFATDVYSLGAILFHLLTGRPPFAADSSFATIKAVIEAAPPSPSQLNPAIDLDLETICLKCLSKAPGQRYASAEALAEDLERWLAGQPILARPATGLQKARMWLRRSPKAVTLTLPVLVSFVACATLAWSLLHHANPSNPTANPNPTRRPSNPILQSSGAPPPASGPNTSASAIQPMSLSRTGVRASAALTGRMPRAILTYCGSTAGGSNGPLNHATFDRPCELNQDAQTRIWVVECASGIGGHRIRMIDTNGQVSTVAGGVEFGCVDGPGTRARFHAPSDIVFDSLGNAYVADSQNHRIRKIDTKGGVSTFAGSTAGYRDGHGTNAQFRLPVKLAIDSANNLYVADSDNHRVRKITPAADVSTLAGTDQGFADGPAGSARFNNPNGLAWIPDGTLLVADGSNGAVRRISPSGRVSTVLTNLGRVTSVSTAPDGNWFVGYTLNGTNYYQRFTADGTRVWTITSVPGFRDGDIASARFEGMSRPVFLNNGSLLIADPANHRIRLVATDWPTPGCVAPPEGIVAWWKGEGNGSNALGANHAMFADRLAFSGGKVGQAFDFDGSPISVAVPAHSSLNVKSLTIEGWIHPRDAKSQAIVEYSIPETYGLLFWLNVGRNGNADVGTPGALLANLTAPEKRWHILATDAGVVPLNQWTHVALTYDQPTGVGCLFVNGRVAVSTNFGTFVPVTSLPLNIGSRQGFYPFNGKMDELAIYNRALSSNEIGAIYEAGTAGKCGSPIPPSLVDIPTTLAVVLHSPVILQPAVSGTAPISYQWLHEGVPLVGATNFLHFIPAVTIAQTGGYSLVLSNACGQFTGTVARLSLLHPSGP